MKNAPQHFQLRGYDAVHLASALAISIGELVFVSWDDELKGAAAAAGLSIAPS